MRKIPVLFLALSAYCLSGCNGGAQKEKAKQFPKPGSLVISAEMPVTGDPLNHFTFSVKVIADSDISKGVYDVDADFGPNFAEGKFTMPQNIEDAKPVIRKSDKPYTFIIGFKLPNDTTFYDYYEVSSNQQSTKMQYIKAYSF